jgi:hypothetical protein
MKVTGLAEALRQIEQIKDYVKSDDGRSEMAVAGLRGAASVFDRNFRSEGGLIGGWASLSEETIRERVRLGFPEGPILVRHGDLRQLTTTSLMSVNGSGTFSKTDSQGKTITVTLVAKQGSAIVTAGGEKAYNQVRTGRVPARPYWFVNSDVMTALRASSIEQLASVIGRIT